MARLPLADRVLRARCADVARDDVLHEFHDPHARARNLGGGAHDRRRNRARARAWEARQPVVAVDDGCRFPRLGRCVSRARTERVVLPALVVLAPRDGVDARGGGGRTARALRAAAVGRRRLRVRAHLRRPSGDALLRPRRGARVRPDLADRRGSASMKRLLLVGLVALASPASAFAHATLEHSGPPFRQRLHVSPSAAWLDFDQSVKALAHSIRVYSSNGDVVSLHAHDGKNPRYVYAPLRRALPKDAYTVRWHVISDDGHVVSGVYTFGVRMEAPPPTEAYGASGPTRTEHVVRWLYFLALALTIGALGFRLVVMRGLVVPPALEKRLLLLAAAGVVGVLEVGIAAFLLRCEDVLQLPFGKFLYGDLSPISGGTRYGKTFVAMTLGFALVAAFVYLAWLLERPRLYAPALALALVFVGGLSVSGHDAVDPGSSWKSELADWVHLSCVSLWIGGLVALAVALWPAAPALRREVFERFSRFATVLVALVLAAGTYLAIVRLPAFHDLWAASYGRVLLVKLALVALVLAWGAVHRFFVRPALESAGDGFLVRVGRSVVGESLAGIAVLLVAAVLVDSKPPQPGTSSSSSRSAYAGAVGSSSWRK